ncbi:DUF7282 domain-containing protein [Kushneria phosphatilytica]|uniref:DUF7282 domain-containing protein n=1 Tax=Kushneria phosphatilytica TaxID=657387 RepID=A0A1S1NST7_9GAMM|nr:hypothetical protein [Kushneria phosphatilytica]OHV08413.1 hypothetical protein BH688_13995 [Kushneria phosphatilytica]QEL09839.1 hypothetical protein FY550_00960 [Kushneria phosphatilytica]
MTPRHSNRTLMGLLTVAALTLPNTATADGVTPSLSVQDQSESFGHVTVRNIDIPEDGFVIIHDASASHGSGHGPVVGRAFLQAGHHARVSVGLSDSVQQGEQLTAMLHRDTGDRYSFERGSDHPRLDPPVMLKGHQVTRSFTVTDVLGSASG